MSNPVYDTPVPTPPPQTADDKLAAWAGQSGQSVPLGSEQTPPSVAPDPNPDPTPRPEEAPPSVSVPETVDVPVPEQDTPAVGEPVAPTENPPETQPVPNEPNEPQDRSSDDNDDADDIAEQIRKIKNMERYYSTNKVASLFDVTPETVRNWIDRGEIKAVKMNGYWRVSRTEILRFANARFQGVEN